MKKGRRCPLCGSGVFKFEYETEKEGEMEIWFCCRNLQCKYKEREWWERKNGKVRGCFLRKLFKGSKGKNGENENLKGRPKVELGL